MRPNDPQQLLRRLFGALLMVSPERRQAILGDIAEGSLPRPMYYGLLGLSALIAGFGLLTNSPAVVIGAMLVSPLMTPIFGISLGLSRGDLPLLRHALLAEFGGVLLVIVLARLLGALPFPLEATAEILARTRPTLLDLFVATLAGLAGCLAMLDERLSPALPGVAIATSLTPPLAASGLCLAFGAYTGAWGAFLLFFANFLAILTVSTTLLLLAGFVTRAEIGSAMQFVRRFAAAGLGLLVVVVLLTESLSGILHDWRTTKTINAVLETALADDPTTTLETVVHHSQGGQIQVLSTVRTPRVLAPQKVQQIEEALTQHLGAKVQLFVRCSITKDVTATGSTTMVRQPNLNGDFTKTTVSSEGRALQLAEQTVREWLASIPNMLLDTIDAVRLPSSTVFVVSIQSPRAPLPSEVQETEHQLQRRLGDPHARLLLRTIASSDTSSKGRVLFGHAHFGERMPEVMASQSAIEQRARAAIEHSGTFFVTSLDAVPQGTGWAVRAEVVGPQVLTPQHIQHIEQTLSQESGQTVSLTVWARTDLIVTRQRYDSVDGYRAALQSRQESPADTPQTTEGLPALSPAYR